MALTTKTSIGNMALLHLGHTGLMLNVDTEQSPEAIYCRQFYDPARKEALELHPWNFAKKTSAELAERTDQFSDFELAFELPTDWIRMIRFVRPSAELEDLEYDIYQGRALATNEAVAQIDYVYDITDATYFSPTFVTALSYRLAAFIAMPMTGKEEVQMANYQMFLATNYNAKALDHNNNRRDPGLDTDLHRRYVDARGYGRVRNNQIKAQQANA